MNALAVALSAEQCNSKVPSSQFASPSEIVKIKEKHKLLLLRDEISV